MKVLLDECLPLDFRHHLPGHEVHTAQWAGMKGLKNGELLQRTEAAGYDALLTVDAGIPYQQNLTAVTLCMVVIRSSTNQIEDLLPLTGAILGALKVIRPGQIAVVP